MELRTYWRIILKRLWITLLLIGIVLVSYGLWRPAPSSGFMAHMRFVVGLRPEEKGNYYTFDRYYTWLTAEYLVDDLAEVVKSRAFAERVSEVAKLPIPAGSIQGATSAGKLHRILDVRITWPDAAQLEQIANATAYVLTQESATFFAQLGTEAAVASLIDPPQISPIGASLRQRLELPLRLLLAVAAGIGLAFLLDYLDDTIRHRDDLAALGVPIDRKSVV